MIEYIGEGLGGGMRLEREAPVLEIDFDTVETYPNGDKLPGVWITNPVCDEEGELLGRTYVNRYPDPDYPDTDGSDALWYGGTYYDEGMGYATAEDHDKRIGCFRAAELLYRHSAGRGNAVAYMCLGYVYSYDRCEGKYWRDPQALDAGAGNGQPYPREERALECLRIAAEADICEACYKLGDMYKHGTGCDPDADEAFRWYVRASELMARERPVVLGSVALRLAGCYEEGFGCEHDFARALEWYKQAVAGLEAAVGMGETWYTRALAGARAGVKRCEQEISCV